MLSPVSAVDPRLHRSRKALCFHVLIRTFWRNEEVLDQFLEYREVNTEARRERKLYISSSGSRRYIFTQVCIEPVPSLQVKPSSHFHRVPCSVTVPGGGKSAIHVYLPSFTLDLTQKHP